MPKLNQVVAVERGLKSSMETEVTKLYHACQKSEPFNGITKTYEAFAEDGEQLPGEHQKVVTTVEGLLENLSDHLARLWDVTATKVWANTEAKADIVIDSETLLKNVPVEYLMFLEKWLVNIKTILGKVPTLDPAYDWSHDEARSCHVTPPMETFRTKRVPRHEVEVPATDKHPAQVRRWDEDMPVGRWKKVQLSGALPLDRLEELKKRVSLLQKAIIFAREEANSMEVQDRKPSRKLLEYLFV